MILSLDVLPAHQGDCLLLHYGTVDEPHLMVIDGGPSRVYAPHLRPRLLAIREARGLEATQSLPVDVVLVSHVDDDHIKGILDLTRELRDQAGAQQPKLVRVGSLWHNSFDDILETNELTRATASTVATAALAGDLDPDEVIDFDVARVLVSISQGRALRDAAELLHWRVNREFEGHLITSKAGAAPVSLPGGVSVTVVGPMQPELESLQAEHDAWLRDHPDAIDVGTIPAAYVDKSVPNLSSLVLLVEAAGRRMLLTGDARGDKILEGLALVGRLDDGGPALHVDVLKVPHHGSANNLDDDFFARVTADHYVFSGDGEHGNPERATFEMLRRARGDAPYTVHLTYPIDEIDRERKNDWATHQRQEQRRRDRKPTPEAKARVRVRPDWDPESQSLAQLFEAHPLAAGQSIEVATGGRPHVIDFGTPLGTAWPGLI